MYLISGVIFAQDLPEKENDTLIVWTEGRKLTWSDFQPANFEGTRAATSDIGIDILTVSSSLKGYTHEVFSYFLKKSSSSETDDPGVLRHEQLHFDIAELYARKIRHKLDQLKGKKYSVKEYHSIIDHIYEQYFEEQNAYDKETKHSMDTVKQQEWALRIAKELKALEHARSSRYR
jgi:hypothetical protein